MLRKFGSYPKQNGLAIALRERDVDEDLLQYLSYLGWEHINLTGDYIWKKSSKIKEGKFRPLRQINLT